MDTLSGTPEELLTPYLSAVMSSSEVDPQANCVDFSLFYIQHQDRKISPSLNSRTLTVPSLPPVWTEVADQSAEAAEKLFWDAIKVLGRSDETDTFWPRDEHLDETSGDEL